MSSSSEVDEGDLSDGELQRRFAQRALTSQNGAKDGDDESDSEQPNKGKRVKREIGSLSKEGIEEKLAEFEVTSKLPWPETFVIDSERLEDDVLPDNDFQREDAFYQHALAAANKARKLLEKHKIPITRPEDYFAEMIKTDDHMRRVRHHALNEAQRIEASQKARKEREMKKFGKKIQVEVLQKRQKEKRKAMEETDRHRKSRKNQLSNVEEDFGVSVDKEGSDAVDKKPFQKSQKRMLKDKKYKSGGKRSVDKRNTKDSAGDTSSFNLNKNRKAFAGHSKAGGKGKKGGKNKRPGKAARKKN